MRATAQRLLRRRLLACRGAQARSTSSTNPGKSEVAGILPVCNIEKRVSLPLCDVVASYNALKGAIDKDLGSLSIWADRGSAEAPGRENLETELRWLVEDALSSDEDRRAVFRGGGSGERQQQGRAVRSRLSLDELGDVWRYRLRERVPIQYILGTAAWYDLELRVGPGVLIPRPETEVLLDYALEALRGGDGALLASGPWLDLGTGSGALAIGVALHGGGGGGGHSVGGAGEPSPKPAQGGGGGALDVTAVDASREALAYVAENVRKYALEDRVRVAQGSWFEALKRGAGGEAGEQAKFSGILSNPPYIGQGEMSGLQAEVRLHEPASALASGPDGMDDLVHIVTEAPHFLAPGGFLGLETGGALQTHRLSRFLSQNQVGLGLTSVQIKPDLQGVERFLIARKST